MNENEKITLEINKLHRKFQLWKKRPNQINSTILRLFFEKVDDKGFVDREELYKEFHIRMNHTKNFIGSFEQMCNFGEKNNGKVFDLINGKVKLWDPIAEYASELFG